MKYKVIAEVGDGIICANKSNITCFIDNQLIARVEEVNGTFPYIGDVLPEKATNNTEFYWSYTRKEWDKINNEFQKLKAHENHKQSY